MNDPFVDAVKAEIQNFNETKGRRKELAPDIVDGIPLPNRKYGRILEIGEDAPPDLVPDLLSEAINKMAKATVRTLLRLNPRPHIMSIGMFENRQNGKYLFRFKIPRRLHKEGINAIK